MSPLSPELPTPLDQDDRPANRVNSIALQQKVLPLLRHDGHIASHVSGLGGGSSEAYDGRSYLPDDAEVPNHPLDPPAGARSGDNPLLLPLRPHPLRNRGQRYHRLLQKTPASANNKFDELMDMRRKSEESVGEEGNDGDDSDGNVVGDDIKAVAKLKLENDFIDQAIVKDEQGDGYGFVESGSFGEYKRGLMSSSEKKKRSAPRLKLSTEKKTAPKMACTFCRIRKIACGIGDTEGTCK